MPMIIDQVPADILARFGGNSMQQPYPGTIPGLRPPPNPALLALYGGLSGAVGRPTAALDYRQQQFQNAQQLYNQQQQDELIRRQGEDLRIRQAEEARRAQGFPIDQEYAQLRNDQLRESQRQRGEGYAADAAEREFNTGRYGLLNPPPTDQEGFDGWAQGVGTFGRMQPRSQQLVLDPMMEQDRQRRAWAELPPEMATQAQQADSLRRSGVSAPTIGRLVAPGTYGHGGSAENSYQTDEQIDAAVASGQAAPALVAAIRQVTGANQEQAQALATLRQHDIPLGTAMDKVVGSNKPVPLSEDPVYLGLTDEVTLAKSAMDAAEKDEIAKLTDPTIARAARARYEEAIKKRQQYRMDRGKKPAAQAAPADQSGEVSIKTDAEYEALPSGTVFVGPDGVRRRKP